MKVKKEYFNYVFENDKAMICEIAFFLGEKKICDTEIKDLIKVCNNDGYVIFYVFCKFLYDKFVNVEYKDIYEFLENETENLFADFKKVCFE